MLQDCFSYSSTPLSIAHGNKSVSLIPPTKQQRPSLKTTRIPSLSLSMASTSNNNASTRMPSGARGSARPSSQHLPPRWNEPALAHGSPSPYFGRQGAPTVLRSNLPATVYRTMERGPALVPELENDRDEMAYLMRSSRTKTGEDRSTSTKRGGGGGFMKRIFDSGSGSSNNKNPAVVTRPKISAPSAPQKIQRVLPVGFANSLASGAAEPRGPPPQRPTRPPVELSPTSPRAPPPDMAALKAAAAAARVQTTAKPVVIRPENLGSAADALRSHPVRAPELLSARKAYHRKTSVVSFPAHQGQGVAEMHPGRGFQRREDLGLPVEMPAAADDVADSPVEEEEDVVVDPKLARRRGMIFDMKSLTSFPEPNFGDSPASSSADNDDDDNHHQQQQSEPEPEPETEVSYMEESSESEEDEDQTDDEQQQPLVLAQPKVDGIPPVVLIPAPEPARTTVDHLTVDYPFHKVLRQELAGARNVVAHYEELGEALCGLSGGAVDDPTDVGALLDVLEDLARRSDDYTTLSPTLDLFAHDRRVNVRDTAAVARGLVQVLNTRNEAVAAATHHKKKARALEKRLAEVMGTSGGAGSVSPH